MAPYFLPFFYPSKIEQTTAFMLRSIAHTMLGTVILLYMCTLIQPLYTYTYDQGFSMNFSLDEFMQAPTY